MKEVGKHMVTSSLVGDASQFFSWNVPNQHLGMT